MSAFKQSMRKLGVRAGLLAGTSLAVVAIAGVGASSASAACSGTIEGQGSSLQKVAQTVIWAPGYKTAACPGGGAEATYTATSSGKGLGKWGYTGAAIDTTVSYIGTDDGPNTTQLGNAKTKGGTAPIVVPVAQTAISIIAHPPANCSISKISNARLEEAFSGKAITWTAIGATGTGCSGSLTRVVRAEGSGTTYQFKNYLSLVNSGEPCAASPTKWEKLEEIGAEEKPNITWPECGSTKIAPKTAAGGGAVAQLVKETAGTIGYAALPDAATREEGTTVRSLQVEDGKEGGTSLFASPKGSKNEEANCEGTEYSVPAAGRNNGTGTGEEVDWSKVFGGNPTVNGGFYPICTLTYDLGWKNFQTAGFAEGIGKSVKHYYEFILSNKLGTTEKKWYTNLPSLGAVGSATNVQSAAEFAVTKITSN
jgi:ABC-type phosphate transport system substrate-binding protein